MTTTDHGGPVTSRESQPGSSRLSVRPDDADLPPGVIQRAALLVGAVHDEGPREVAQVLRRLDRNDLYALAVTLAAMVPDDRTPAQLLAWNDRGDCPRRQPLPNPPTVDEQPLLFPVVDATVPATGQHTGNLRPCGTRTAAERHIARGEPMDAACDQARRDYYAEQGRKRRQRAREESAHSDESAGRIA